MRIARITLTDVRGVASGSVRFDPSGVTVVEGPNESGKSTLVAAFELLLTAAHTSKHRNVRDLQPVGRDVAPTVEAEFTLGPHRLTYRKGWVRRPFAEVRIDRADGTVEQLAGADAEARVAELLDEHVDAHLRAALNVLQGTSEVGVVAGESPSIVRALDGAAGQVRPGDEAPDDQSQTLIDAANTEFLRYWTPSGQPRKERTDRAEALDRAVEDLDRLRGRLEEVDLIHPLLDAHRADLAECADVLERAEASIGDLRSELEAARRIATEAEAARAQVELRAVQSTAATRAVEERAALRSAVERAEAALVTSRQSLADAAPARAAADERLASADAQVSAARQNVEDASADLSRARADQGHLEREVNRTVLRERLERVVVAVEARRAAQGVLNDSPVTEEQLGAIEAAAAAADEARIRADAAAPVVTTTVLGAATVLVDGRPVAGVDERAVAASATVEVADVVRVEVVPGVDVEQLAGERDRASAELSARCRAAGVADLAEARRSSTAREAAQRDLAAALDTIDRDARDLTVEELRALADRLDAESVAYLADRPASPGLPVDLPAARTATEEAQVRLDGHRARLAALEEQLASVRTERQDLDVAHAREESRVGVGAEQLAEAVAALEAARALHADDALADAVTSAAQAQSDALERAEELERQRRAAAPEVLEERLRNAEAVIVSNRSRVAALEREIGGCEARLEEAGRDGLATQVDEAASGVEHLRLVHRSTEARAAAAELLVQTLERHRAASRRRYLQPLRERIEHYGRIVFGPGFEVELDDELAVVQRRLDGVELPVSQLSVGAREQLALLVRLALASLVEADDGAPVVIDDALGWSDRNRLEAMCVALQAAGRDAQVIVLTCSPGRFAQVGGARVVTIRDDDANPTTD